MNQEQFSRTTFAVLDREKGVEELPAVAGDEYPLPAWYRSVREVPIDKLSIEDIAKALRQQIHPEHVVPRALQILQTDPLAGEMYDGELFASLNGVTPDHWVNHSDDTALLRLVIERLLPDPTIADDIRRDAEELGKRAGISR